jgi:hypothetical protein
MAEIKLVLGKCSNCGIATTRPEGYKGFVFCKPACQTEYNDKRNREYLDAEAAKFLAQHEDFYPCPYNQKLISDLLAQWKQTGTAENLASAYMHLLAEGKILGKLTRKDIDAMDSPTYDARERIDPNLGGALAEVEATGNAKFASPVSYKTGGTGGWEAMQRANLAQRQAQADERALTRSRGAR